MADFHLCAKQPVTAILTTPNGEMFVGHNYRRNYSAACPRVVAGCKTGEGYELCTKTCGQFAHAEIIALNKAQDKAEGATMTIFGHSYACDDCMDAMLRAGIEILAFPEDNTEIFIQRIRKGAA